VWLLRAKESETVKGDECNSMGFEMMSKERLICAVMQLKESEKLRI
jgi:hypothetical protein